MSTHRTTPAFDAAIEKYSNMPAHLLAPSQYAEYTPTFQSRTFTKDRGWIPGMPAMKMCSSNLATRYVAKGVLSVHNLLDAEQMTRADDETEDLKEMIMEHLGCSEEEAAGFTVDTGEETVDPEDFSLDMDPPSVVE